MSLVERLRDAITGRIVTVIEAVRRPASAIIEKINKRKGKRNG